jgi:hypothetical protein
LHWILVGAEGNFFTRLAAKAEERKLNLENNILKLVTILSS